MFNRYNPNNLSTTEKVNYLLDKGNYLKEQHQRTKLEKQFKERLKFSKKIENYIPPNWDHNKHPLHDVKFELHYSMSSYGNDDAVIMQAIKVNSFRLMDLNNDLNYAFYIVVDVNDKATVFLFYGNDENETLERIVIKKAKYFPNVPQVVDGKIVGQITLPIIMKLFHSYDPQYALYLKKLYDNGKINKNNII